MEPWGGRDGRGGGVGPTTFEEASMERSKSFVKALHELKNLRPQLYSAAEYCEKSYLHSEQKQMVLDNLKDYAVRALVNAVDHLGTVAYKLTDLLEQQTSEVSNLDVKVTCLNQQVLTSQTYTDKEGLRQQQMSAATPKHHKHYILPYTGSRMQTLALLQTEIEQDSKPRPYPSAKTLSWHLATENQSASNGHQSKQSLVETRTSKVTFDAFHLLGKDQSVTRSPLSRHTKSTNGNPSTDIVAQAVGGKDRPNTKQLSAFGSFDNPSRYQIQRAPVRSKSMLAALFVKHKSSKLKKISVP